VSEVLRTLRAEPLRRFKPYPAYKDSGVEWLGEIPTHWEVKRLKTLASVQLSNVDKKSVEGQEPVRLCNYTDVYYNDRITPDLEFMTATATPEQIRRFSLLAGDVLITKDSESWTDIAVPALVVADLPDVLCGYHLALVRPEGCAVGTFLSRAFSAIGPRDQFQVAANGITRFGLGGDAIRTGLFAMPPEPEQRAIAAFLDRETARIDALVAKKERLIELLQEKRTALITGAVTKGLDPSVPMKDSGVEWLGEIPAHWVIAPIGFRYDVQLGKMLDSSKITGLHLRPYLRVFDVQWGAINTADLPEMDFNAEARAKFRLEVGDLLVNEGGSYPGRAAIWQGGIDECYYQKALHRLRALRLREDSPRFLFFLMYWAANQGVFVAGGNETTIEHLPAENLRRYRFAFPAHDEQRAIADFLDRETARIDALIAKVRAAIDRLKELRTALISAAVTGKIDVREEAE
jgi:type I restriction enzyme S subunit